MAILMSPKAMKKNPAKYSEKMKGKTLLMIFAKPSLRTRVSFEAGMDKLGGHAIYYDIATSPMGKGETIHDTANCASRYVDIISARLFEHEDMVELAVDCEYDDYDLTEIINIPGHASYRFSWTPPGDCDQIVPVTFTATDENNLSVELVTNIHVEPVRIVVTSDTTLFGYTSSVDIYLQISGSNANVGAFDLTLEWDHNAFYILGSEFGASFADWEYLNASVNPYGPGSLILVGLANLDTGYIPPLREGSYLIATLTFQTSGDPDFQGFFVNIKMPIDQMADNVLADSTGYIVYHPAITEGFIYFMNLANVIVGDTNLNSLPYETGDAVVFIDHLVDPIACPFNPVQRLASDCNQDLIPETVADLVYMLNIINGGFVSAAPDLTYDRPQINLTETRSGVDISLAADISIGGMLAKISHQGSSINNIRTSSGYKTEYRDSDGVLVVLVYPEQINGELTGNLLSIKFDEGHSSDIIVLDTEFSTPGGVLLK